ncbi:ribosome maturation factor RimP [Alicyclobacillaceae bacterium I2511]|nr:ribosome maturation factor RimP [Alicyclobacillaceae bacterium I2511]
MPKERVTDIVERLAEPIVSTAGVELVDVEYKKEGDSWYLRVFIDKPGGVDLDDCGRVSEALSDLLDEVDPIPTAYFLEVSSPGAERPLKKPRDFQQAIGSYVSVGLYEPMDGQKTFAGVLVHYDESGLTLAVKKVTKTHEVVIPTARVASARLAVQF